MFVVCTLYAFSSEELKWHKQINEKTENIFMEKLIFLSSMVAGQRPLSALRISIESSSFIKSLSMITHKSMTMI